MFKRILISFLLCIAVGRPFEISVTFPELARKQESDGREVVVVPAGETFAIIIEIQQAPEHIETLEMAGLEAFKIIGQAGGTSSTIMNGTTSTTRTITLHLRGEKPGIYKIGPVQAKAGDKQATSGVFYCRIEEGGTVSSAAAAQKRAAARGASLEAELIPSKSEVYWGEPLEVTLRYIAYGQIYQLAPEIPEQANFLSLGMQDRGGREVLRNGKPTKVYEQVITYLPIKTGSVSMGPMPVHYTVPVRQRGRLSHFDLFFGPQAEQKETTAPAIQVRVKPLPKTNKKVSIVGKIDSFVLGVDKPTAQVNDPLKLSVSITGKGNLEFAEELPLSFPAGFKIYKAKSLLHRHHDQSGKVTKTIEYVLQVNKSGQVEIPAQQLVYFDPEADTYKTLQSNTVELFLSGDVVEQPKKSIDELAREVNEPQGSKKNEELAYIFEETSSSAAALPWWLVILCMIIPLFLYVRSLKKWLAERCLKFFKKPPTNKEIIEQAKKELDQLVAAGNIERLHQFFIKTMAALWQRHEQEMTEQVIEQHLRREEWSEERLQEFMEYLQASASLHFTKQEILPQTREMLLKKSQYWLLLLGK